MALNCKSIASIMLSQIQFKCLNLFHCFQFLIKSVSFFSHSLNGNTSEAVFLVEQLSGALVDETAMIVASNKPRGWSPH